ncbi:MAG: deoxycytidylate deaminase [Promethearchaeota archaeon]
MKISRPDWDKYFLDIAQVVATRSTCFRHKVGAVIVKDKKIISTGYNGAPKYQKNCEEIGFCYRNKNNIKSLTQLEKCRAVGSHAESNAICLAAKDGSATEGATIYIHGHTDVCSQCRAMIANAGIIRVLIRKPSEEIIEYNVREWKVHPVDLRNS